MRLDARIPLRLQASPLAAPDVLPLAAPDVLPLAAPDALPLAAPDPDGVLLLVGAAGQDGSADSNVGGWGAVRRLPGDIVQPPGRAHATGCACCGGRSGLAIGLSELFRQGAGGGLGPFRQVVLAVPASDLATARRLLAADVLVAARYRVASPLG